MIRVKKKKIVLGSLNSLFRQLANILDNVKKKMAELIKAPYEPPIKKHKILCAMPANLYLSAHLKAREPC